jgi:hypothetical protein
VCWKDKLYLTILSSSAQGRGIVAQQEAPQHGTAILLMLPDENRLFAADDQDFCG